MKTSELAKFIIRGENRETLDKLFGRSLCDITNRDLFFSLIAAMRLSDDGAVEKIFQISRKINVESDLSGTYADNRYLGDLGFLFSASVISGVRSQSSKNESDYSDQAISLLEHRLLGNEAELLEYISFQRKNYSVRSTQEYRYLTAFRLGIFPYKYLTDYKNNCLRATPREELKVSFVFCVKNRSTRTRLAISSLLFAYEDYVTRRLYEGPVADIEIIIVEDIGVDNIGTIADHSYRHKIFHYVVETGVSWTRAGLLNYGLRQAAGDVVAFCDVDFLFDFQSLDRLFLLSRTFDFDKQVLAVNCIETECHVKDKKRYSRSSPYGYMWVVGRAKALEAGGYNEDYIGHGFEDRDFEYRLSHVLGMSVVGSVTVDPTLVVFHLSHNTRTGDDGRDKNRERFMARNEGNYLVREDWGRQKQISISKYDELAPRVLGEDSPDEKVDVLILAHNSYHAWTVDIIKNELVKAGLRYLIASPLPRYSDEGVEEYCKKNKLNFVRLDDYLSDKRIPRSALVFNDWDAKVAKPFVSAMNDIGVPTIGLIEGINDYKDVDTGRVRRAYRTVKHVLAPGKFEVDNYFLDLEEKVHVVGVPRIEKIKRNVAGVSRRKHALINCNFSYGVLEGYRDTWLADCLSACRKAGYTFEITRHRADKGDYSSLPVSSDDFYTTLERCSVLMSRFSTCILEALAVGVLPIYYNPGFERVEKFQNSMGAYPVPKTPEELLSVLQGPLEWDDSSVSKFLDLHCSLNDSSGRRIAGAIRRTISYSNHGKS